MKKIHPQVTQSGLVKRPVHFHSRAPMRAQSPIRAQHPTSSNSISASVKPFGKPLA